MLKFFLPRTPHGFLQNLDDLGKWHGWYIRAEFHQLITVSLGKNIGTQGHNLTQLNISWAQIFQYEPELLRRNTPGNGMLFQNSCDLSQPFSISAVLFLLLFFSAHKLLHLLLSL